MKRKTIKLTGTVQQGYGVASGLNKNSPFPDGTIKLQAPHFKSLGLDLEKLFPNIFWGTLNIDISPTTVTIKEPDYNFRKVAWIDNIEPENFLLVHVTIIHKDKQYPAMIYYPDPATKPKMHKHNHSRLEVIANKIEDIDCGDTVDIIIRNSAIQKF